MRFERFQTVTLRTLENEQTQGTCPRGSNSHFGPKSRYPGGLDPRIQALGVSDLGQNVPFWTLFWTPFGAVFTWSVVVHPVRR